MVVPTISPIHTTKIHSKRLKAQHKELNRMKSGCTICGHRRAPEPVFLSLVKCLYTLTLTRQPFSTKSALPRCANRREAKADWTRKHDAMTHWLCQNKFSKCVCVCLGCGDGCHLSHHLFESEESRWVQDLCFSGCFQTQQGECLDSCWKCFSSKWIGCFWMSLNKGDIKWFDQDNQYIIEYKKVTNSNVRVCATVTDLKKRSLPPDRFLRLHWPAGLHVLLCPSTVALLQAATPVAVLPSTRGWRCQGPAGGVSGDHPQQGTGAAQIQKGPAL